MNRLRKLIFKSDFTRNVAVMMSGNGLALIFPFLVAPLISRIYSPDDFAGFELFVKIAMLVSSVASLRFEIAILLPKKQSEADDLFKLCIKILLIATVVSAAISWPVRSAIGRLLNNSDLANLLWLLPLIVFFIGGQHILTQYAIRMQRFKRIASSKVLGAISNNGGKYMLGLFSATALSLTWGQILGHGATNLIFLRIKKVREVIGQTFRSKIDTRYLFRKYRDFPIVNSAHAFFDEGQKALLLFMISAYYGEFVLGFFAFSWRYLKVPLQVFGVSLSQVLNEKWARDLERGILIKAALRRTIVGLLAMAIIPFSVLFFFGEPIFGFIFGKEWTTAGTYAALMAPWLLVHFVVSPISFIPVLYEKQKTNFTLAVVANVVILTTVAVMSYLKFEFRDVLIAIVALNVLLMVIILIWFYWLTTKPRPQLGSAIQDHTKT